MDIVSTWSLKIAEEVSPNEVDLAPIVANAFIEGGQARKELFYKGKGDEPGAFGAGEIAPIFPWILEGVKAATPFILSMLATGSIIRDLLSVINDILSIRDRLIRQRKSEALPDNPYASLKRALDIFSAKLQAAEIPQDQRDLIVYRVFRALLEEPVGATEFLQKIYEAPGE